MKCTIYTMLKLLSPLHIAAPSDLRFDPATGKTRFGSSGDGTIPCTGVQRMTIVGPGSTEDVPVEENDGKQSRNLAKHRVPVIAGNNIAGRLRRQAGTLVLRALEAKGESVNMSTFSVLMSGAVTGNPSGEDLKYQEYEQARKHPYFGLFGGGTKMLPRNVRVCNALPMIKVLAKDGIGVLRHPHHEQQALDMQPFETVNAWTFRRNDDLKDLSHVEVAEATIKDFQAEFERRQALIIEDQRKNAEGEARASKTSTQTFSALEFVTPGLIFDLVFELDVANEAQVGLFLAALDNFAAEERLGGQSRNGFGQFVMQDCMLVPEDESRIWGGTDPIQIFDNGRLNKGLPTVEAALKAWGQAAGDLTAADLDSYGIAAESKAVRESKRKAKKGE
jgi:CRISPR type IV-associated protein Csf2